MHNLRIYHGKIPLPINNFSIFLGHLELVLLLREITLFLSCNIFIRNFITVRNEIEITSIVDLCHRKYLMRNQ